jgi:hypothetical protein
MGVAVTGGHLWSPRHLVGLSGACQRKVIKRTKNVSLTDEIFVTYKCALRVVPPRRPTGRRRVVALQRRHGRRDTAPDQPRAAVLLDGLVTVDADAWAPQVCPPAARATGRTLVRAMALTFAMIAAGDILIVCGDATAAASLAADTSLAFRAADAGYLVLIPLRAAVFLHC